MKRLHILIAVPVAVITIILIALVFSKNETPETAVVEDLTRNCPLVVGAKGPTVPNTGAGMEQWTVYISNLNKNGPEIAVDQDKRVTPPGATTPSCRFDITKVPGPPAPDLGYTGIDWRIGHTFKGIEAYRGGKVHVTAMLSADRPITFGDAYFYIYDGKKVGAIGKFAELDKTWHKIDISQEIDKESPQVEVWLRLTLHAPISTTGSVYLNDVHVEFVPPPAS